MASQTPRAEQRKLLPADARTQLLEYDMDARERAEAATLASLRRIQQILIGVLISVSTGSVLLAINLVVNASRP